MDEVETSYYLRMRAKDEPGVLADVTRILGDRQISIEAFIQKEPPEGENEVNIILLTHKVREGSMNQAITELKELDAITDNVNKIRMETLG